MRVVGRRSNVWLLMMLVIACGSSDDNGTDSAPDAPVALACDELVGPRSLGVISPIDSGLQIHPTLGFDGERIWLAYTGSDIDDMSVFDTFVLRLDCAGQPLGEPIRATTTAGRSEIDPSIAVGPDSVAVAWTADTPGAANNLDLVVRTFAYDGEPRTDTDVTIEPTSGGQPVVGNAFFSALASLPGGGFVLAGSNVLPGAPTFRAFVQELDQAGGLVGEQVSLAAAGPDTHSDLAITIDDVGTRWAAYTEAQTDGDVAMLASVTQAGTVVSEPLFAGALANRPALATSGSVRVMAAATDTGAERDVGLIATDGTRTALASIGTPGALDHTPTLAQRNDASGAVAFFRNISGFRNQLVVVGFDFDLGNGTFNLGAPIEIVHEIPAPPYAPALTHVSGDIYFVVWAEGMSPEFTLRGEFVTL